jgi:hypothetical protein
MGSRLASGLASGAAGTSALNIATYLDMAIRARPASEVPQKDVESLAQRAGLNLDNDDAAAQRKQAAGALMGFFTGLAGGVTYSAVHPLLRRLPPPVAAAAVGLGVMAATDGVSAALGTTDPRDWALADWAGDIVPHLAYGAATVATYDALRR